MSNKLSQKALDFSMISPEGTIPSPRAQMFRDYMTQPYPDYGALKTTGVDSDDLTDKLIDVVMSPISTISRMNIGRLYEQCLSKLVGIAQEQINKGPLKGMVGISGMSVNGKNYKIFHVVAPGFRAKNRVKAYRGYLETIMNTAEEKLAELNKQGE